MDTFSGNRSDHIIFLMVPNTIAKWLLFSTLARDPNEWYHLMEKSGHGEEWPLSINKMPVSPIFYAPLHIFIDTILIMQQCVANVNKISKT